MKVDTTVRQATLYIAGFELVFSLVMQIAFLLFDAFDMTVVLGNLLGASAAVLNFFLMGLSIQHAINEDPKHATNRMKLSQRLRMLMLLAFAVLALAVPYFHPVAALIPLFFPRIAIALRPLFSKKENETAS